MAIVQFSVVPLGTAGTSLSAYVAAVHDLLAQSPLQSQLTPMGTILEGPLEEILALVARAHEVPFAQGAGRVMTTISIDDRRDKPATCRGKVESVLAKLKP
jgi:uncharacterized protein (TIGR00106 family)